MITENRLRTLARINKVTTGLMEKDYVNSWILYSIFNDEQLNDKLVFKGGTLLHKIYPHT
ncbi:MAG: nucleotidyl transferase AbiEii/AbiGii toxin family protein [Candidatus Saliniplasma sp.]